MAKQMSGMRPMKMLPMQDWIRRKCLYSNLIIHGGNSNAPGSSILPSPFATRYGNGDASFPEMRYKRAQQLFQQNGSRAIPTDGKNSGEALTGGGF
jgi:hypothetical protein